MASGWQGSDSGRDNGAYSETPMKLNLLTLHESDLATLPDGVYIRRLTHPITEMFMALLPAVEINGSSKIAVVLGPQGEAEAFDNVLGVTAVFVEDFDFAHFLAQDRAAQNQQLLELLRQCLMDIAHRKGPNLQAVQAINAAADAVVQSQFQLTLPIKKLGKRSKDRKSRVEVFRRLDSEVGEAWYCEVTRAGQSTPQKLWMSDVPGFIDRRDYFKTAEISGNSYIAKSRLGWVVFETPLA
ncbi:hypothetical protein [Delftia deserti]|uniref:Uncharacterized protein n=1 Tax=Delftia deserti TaxID=1651218 RepID=A0ABW5EIZ9_9BURK